jgi:dipeptidyl aminopeptidase/acylaminoacyl peptidase
MLHRLRGNTVPLVAAALLGLAALAAPARASLPELIPLNVLLGNPEKAQPRISPDGTRLAYIAPSAENVLNVWVRTIGKQDDAMVTNDTHRGIRFYTWAEDGKRLLYIQDKDGDENWRVYAVAPATKTVKDLTPFEGVRSQNLITDRQHPKQLLVGLNQRDKTVFDMHRIDLETGEVTLDTENPGDVQFWLTDADFQIRAAMAQNPGDGSTILRVRDAKDKPWRDLMTWPFGENGTALSFAADGKSLYVESSLGSDTTRLLRVDAKTGKELEALAHNPRADVGSVVIHPDTYKAQAVEFNYLKGEWKVLDPAVKDDFAALAKAHPGEYSLTSRDHADDTWVVAYDEDDGPVHYYIYDRATKKTDLLFVNRPELQKYTLAEMKPVTIEARDGTEIPAYLTLPAGVEAKNLPLVLHPHGGPWARDYWGFDPTAQWLANRGYAVLQPNFRGSVGYGKEFLNTGNKEWGVGVMQHDLSDAVKWAVAQGIADPENIAIMGGSYGGYATLAGLTFTPDLYACGVDIVGPSHIKTLFESIPPYWATFKKELVLRVGDVETDEEWNRKISPLFHVDNIEDPLLIGQGANDPRVNINESDQIVKAMREKDLAVTYVVYTDEGHGFARPENRLDFYGRADQFLAECLEGRSQEFQKVEGSSAEVR